MHDFEWTSLIGPIIQVIVLSATVIGIFLGLKAEVRVLRHDVRTLEKQIVALTDSFSQLGKILTQVAVQDTRLSLMEKQIDELRHGQGFVKETRPTA